MDALLFWLVLALVPISVGHAAGAQILQWPRLSRSQRGVLAAVCTTTAISIGAIGWFVHPYPVGPPLVLFLSLLPLLGGATALLIEAPRAPRLSRHLHGVTWHPHPSRRGLALAGLGVLIGGLVLAGAWLLAEGNHTVWQMRQQWGGLTGREPRHGPAPLAWGIAVYCGALGMVAWLRDRRRRHHVRHVDLTDTELRLGDHRWPRDRIAGSRVDRVGGTTLVIDLDDRQLRIAADGDLAGEIDGFADTIRQPVPRIASVPDPPLALTAIRTHLEM